MTLYITTRILERVFMNIATAYYNMGDPDSLQASHPVAQTITSPGEAHTDGVEESVKTTHEGRVSSPTFKSGEMPVLVLKIKMHLPVRVHKCE